MSCNWFSYASLHQDKTRHKDLVEVKKTMVTTLCRLTTYTLDYRGKSQYHKSNFDVPDAHQHVPPLFRHFAPGIRPMKIDQDQLKRIETLARLQLTEDEEDRLRDQLSQILDHVETIDELDLEDVEPLTHPLDLSNVMRADERQDSLNAKAVLRNAPQRTGQFFKVPQIIDNDSG